MNQNKRYENYVFLTIAEISFDLFKKSDFTSYSSYCITMNKSLKSRELSKFEAHDIIEISKMVEKIYSMNNKKSGEYIAAYFNCGHYLDFEKSVRFTKEFFPIVDSIWKSDLSVNKLD